MPEGLARVLSTFTTGRSTFFFFVPLVSIYQFPSDNKLSISSSLGIRAEYLSSSVKINIEVEEEGIALSIPFV